VGTPARFRCSAVHLYPGDHRDIHVLDRNTTKNVAIAWKNAVADLPRVDVLECRGADLKAAWAVIETTNLHKLSLVDAISFALMSREGLRAAFAFDHHFASAGFRLVD
jgi:predicted nucleic acid-binding protein